MPFGRFKGHDVYELPTDYLLWLTGIELRDRLRAEVEDALRFRLHERKHADTSAPRVAIGPAIYIDPADVPAIRELIDRGFRAAARVHHPDAGGDAEKMRQLNVLVEKLRSQIEVLS
jgi:hypothetical protein